MSVFLGIDIGGSFVKAGLVEEGGKVLGQETIPVVPNEPLSTIKSVKFTSEGLLRKAKVDVAAVGIACPGPISRDGETLLFLPNLPNWRGIGLRSEFEKLFGIPAVIENDANAAALAEARSGAGRDSAVMIMATLGTGIGGGIIQNGSIFPGAHGAAAEIGHIVVVPDGKKCGCGKRGCLEAYIGAESLLREYHRIGDANPEYLTLRQVIAGARSSEAPSIKLLQWASELLGIALGSIANILDPDCVVIGGGVATAGDFFINAIEERTLAHTMPALRKGIRVVPAKLGNRAGFIGAAILAGEMADALPD